MCTPRRKFDVHAESDAEGTLSGRCGGLVFGRFMWMCMRCTLRWTLRWTPSGRCAHGGIRFRFIPTSCVLKKIELVIVSLAMWCHVRRGVTSYRFVINCVSLCVPEDGSRYQNVVEAAVREGVEDARCR